MIELIKAIALLCSVASLENTKGKWTELHEVEEYQVNCQKHYLNCVDENLKKHPTLISYGNSLKECILNKKPGIIKNEKM